MADSDIENSPWVGGKLHYGKKRTKVGYDSRYINGEESQTATRWRNRYPICPYGCGEEGQLVEILMKDDGAVGVFKDSEQLIFTAPLKMSPNPTQFKVVRGADGNYHYEENS